MLQRVVRTTNVMVYRNKWAQGNLFSYIQMLKSVFSIATTREQTNFTPKRRRLLAFGGFGENKLIELFIRQTSSL